jgi:hypothetical protein
VTGSMQANSQPRGRRFLGYVEAGGHDPIVARTSPDTGDLEI